MKTRNMDPSDFPKLLKLWQEAGLKLRPVGQEKKEALSMMQMNKSACFVMGNRRKLVGSVFGAFNGRRGWIYHLVVHPKYQRKGFGSILMQKAEKALKKMGASRVLLGVWMEDKEVLPFYRKNGYLLIDDSYFFVKDLE